MTYIRSLVVAGFAALSHLPAFALQVVEPVEGNNSFVKVSAREITRIAIENGKIRSLFVGDRELMIEKDADSGQVFIRPLVLDKPINARVVTTSGHTYSLVMQAVDIPQEDIILRDTAAVTDRTGVSDRQATAYERAVKHLLTVMAASDPPVRAQVKQVAEEMRLWEGTRFVLGAIYTERTMIGEKYRLHNVGSERIRIVEQELYRPGVLAIAIENMTLDPGQSTNVFIVKER